MSIENPISTIRKAVKGAAEVTAEENFLETPTQEHYEEALQFFRFIKIFEPEKYEKIIKLGAEGYELKTQMGSDLYKKFTQVWSEVNLDNDIGAEIQQSLVDKNRKSIEEMGQMVKNDPRIVNNFKGREELISKGNEFIKKAALSLNEEFESKSKTKLFDLREFKKLIDRVIKYLRTIT